MKVKIVLKEPTSLIQRHRSAAHDRIIKQKSEKKQEQIEDAVKYCIENGCKGYKALQTGQFPLIKDARTINKHLDSGFRNEAVQQYNRVPVKGLKDMSIE